MAYIIGLATDKEIAELERRGWEIEDAPKELVVTHQPDGEDPADVPMRTIMVWVDSGVFDVMDGPDWEKG